MPVPPRTGFTAAQVRAAARTKGGPRALRLLALAAIYDGGTRSDAAKIVGMILQIVRDWMLRFNAEDAMGQYRKAPSQPAIASREYGRAALSSTK